MGWTVCADEHAVERTRVSHVDLATGQSHPFLINKCGKPGWLDGCGGGLRRPITAAWGPDGALYVVDFGVVEFSKKGMNARPDTGVIWRVVPAGAPPAQPPAPRRELPTGERG